MQIVEAVQKNLGFNTLEKIDPNLQETPGRDLTLGNNALAQAGIPAILLGIFNRLEEDPNLEALDNGQPGILLEKIFGKSTEEVVKQIEEYTKVPNKHSLQELEHISTESLRIIRGKVGDHPSDVTIRRFIAKNKPDVLLYLPPSLRLGIILQNNNLDDRTGKMRGPISNFLHGMESTFNTTGKN